MMLRDYAFVRDKVGNHLVLWEKEHMSKIITREEEEKEDTL